MDLDGAPQQVAELVRVAAVERRRWCRRASRRRGVELRDHPPLGVHRGELAPRGSCCGERPRPAAAAAPALVAAAISWPSLPLGLGRVLALASAASRGVPAGRRRGSAWSCASAYCLRMALDLGELGRQLAVQPLRPGEHVLEREVAQLGGGVLHREQVLDLVVEALADHPAAVRVRRVQQRGDRAGCAGGSRTASPAASFLSVHGTCQTAAPGKRHRREAGAPARTPNSRVVPLDEQRQAEPDLARAPRVGIRHMNQPLKSTSMRRCSQRATAQVAGGEVPVGLDRRRRRATRTGSG